MSDHALCDGCSFEFNKHDLVAKLCCCCATERKTRAAAYEDAAKSLESAANEQRNAPGADGWYSHNEAIADALDEEARALRAKAGT